MIKVADNQGYCSDCGNWAINCKTIIVYSIPEKVCQDCRDKK